MTRFAFAIGLAAAIAVAPSALAVNPTNAWPGAATDTGAAAAVSYKRLMTPREHFAFRKKVRDTAGTDECRTYVEGWRTTIESRAKEKAMTSVDLPRLDACDRAPKSARANEKAERSANPAEAGAAATPPAPASPGVPAAPSPK